MTDEPETGPPSGGLPPLTPLHSTALSFPKRRSTEEPSRLSPLAKIETRPPRVLDFDIETRKVGFHTAGKFQPDGCEPIALAWSWLDGPVEVYVLGSVITLLEKFRRVYDEADIVTAHYIRKFDLPVLNGAMLEHGFPPLKPKLTIDTKLDLRSRAGVSVSQENLAEMLQVAESKFHMSDYLWREAARLTPEGIEKARRRAYDDVVQHKAMYAALKKGGWLKPAKWWRP